MFAFFEFACLAFAIITTAAPSVVGSVAHKTFRAVATGTRHVRHYMQTRDPADLHAIETAPSTGAFSASESGSHSTSSETCCEHSNHSQAQHDSGGHPRHVFERLPRLPREPIMALEAENPFANPRPAVVAAPTLSQLITDKAFGERFLLERGMLSGMSRVEMTVETAGLCISGNLRVFDFRADVHHQLFTCQNFATGKIVKTGLDSGKYETRQSHGSGRKKYVRTQAQRWVRSLVRSFSESVIGRRNAKQNTDEEWESHGVEDRNVAAVVLICGFSPSQLVLSEAFVNFWARHEAKNMKPDTPQLSALSDHAAQMFGLFFSWQHLWGGTLIHSEAGTKHDQQDTAASAHATSKLMWSKATVDEETMDEQTSKQLVRTCAYVRDGGSTANMEQFEAGLDLENIVPSLIAAKDLWRAVKAVLEEMGYNDDTKSIWNNTASFFAFKLARYATPNEDATPEEEAVRLSEWGLLRDFLHDNAARFNYRPRP
ncbi:BZ3500_MvSof-1268-A1-R1_Chr3-3g06513 [Microbotryum saponariae]|uniref:BZ3500_MvSof-1268-A1-R1_Chr3-3g06513 protein n=1 Tax=Microbotryum saponariae TaxID=289078 RepID=A0A2X0LH41_9BASI|nr:BZ3500_MvSof-1268-A1-R1_Chr3-3g06513 [Microbotryum saponariae]SDA04480.1 BZ3501_MvSof-1269-A2-R1_Chr3-2g06200 [Microbotryum saponariae]